MISVVTPFYNEAQILEQSLLLLLESLEKLDGEWERSWSMMAAPMGHSILPGSL